MLNRAWSLLDIKRVDEAARTIAGIATTPTTDHAGDIVEPGGAQFSLPVKLLWQHDARQPIGDVTSAKVTKAGIEIVAEIKRSAEPGRLKDRLDEAWQSIKLGLVGGLSIGFKPIETSIIKETGGMRFLKWSWIELSAVTIPANSEASITTIKSIDTAQRAASGRELRSVALTPPGASGHPQRKSAPEGARMKTISEQISALENKRAASATRMDDVMQKALDEDRTTNTEEQDEFDRLSTEVEAIDKDLVRLRQIERAKAFAAKPVMQIEGTRAGAAARGNGAVAVNPMFAMPAQQKIAPQDYVWNSLVCAVKAHANRRSPYDVIKEEFGEDEIGQGTRAVMAAITKAATVPADTVTTNWATQLVATSIQDFFNALLPSSVYPRLSAMGGKFSFGRAGIVTMPTRASTPTIAGSFVAQGAPIPVRQGAFSSISFTPKKMGVISTFTREIYEHSTPAIDGLIRQAIIDDTAGAIDSILLDATAATTTRPAGLKSGVSATTATAGGGLAALIGDIRALAGALITGTSGNLRKPVWIMNPADVLAASMIPAVAGGGEFPYKDELAAGRLQGYPVIASANVAADTMLFVDAEDFISVTGDTPRFDVSDQATLHMEDTTPLAIGTVGSPATVAAPARNLFQTDCLGIRMLMDINWGLRRTGVVAWTQTMTWN